MIAYCYRSGRIEFGRSIPDGAIKVAQGPARSLRALMSVLARHAYDGKTLLVPGIPEAKTDKQAADALQSFLDWIAPSVAKIQEAK